MLRKCRSRRNRIYLRASSVDVEMMSREVLSCALLCLLSHFASTFHQASALLAKDCLEFDVAEFEEYLSKLELRSVPTAAMMTGGFRCPVAALPFGALKSDWARLILLRDAQPEGSTLKAKLVRLFRVLVVAYYDMEERFEVTGYNAGANDSSVDLGTGGLDGHFAETTVGGAESTIGFGTSGRPESNFGIAASTASAIGRTTGVGSNLLEATTAVSSVTETPTATSSVDEGSVERRTDAPAVKNSTSFRQEATYEIEKMIPTTGTNVEDSTQDYGGRFYSSLTTSTILSPKISTLSSMEKIVNADQISETTLRSNIVSGTGTMDVNTDEKHHTEAVTPQSSTSSPESQTRAASTTWQAPAYFSTSQAADTTAHSEKTVSVDSGISSDTEVTLTAATSTELTTALGTTTKKGALKESTVRPSETIGIVTADGRETDGSSGSKTSMVETSTNAYTKKDLNRNTPATVEHNFSSSSDFYAKTTKENSVLVSTMVLNGEGSTSSINDTSGSTESFSETSFSTETGESTSSDVEGKIKGTESNENNGSSDSSNDRDDKSWASKSSLSTDLKGQEKSASSAATSSETRQPTGSQPANTTTPVAVTSTILNGTKDYHSQAATVKSHPSRIESTKDSESAEKSFPGISTRRSNDIFRIFKHDSISLDRLHDVSSKMKKPPVVLRPPTSNKFWRYTEGPQKGPATTSYALKSLLGRYDEGPVKPRKRGSLSTDVEKNFRWFFNQGRKDEGHAGSPAHRPRNINIQCDDKGRKG